MRLGADNKLKKVKDEATILSLISGAKEENFEVFLWKLIGGSKILGQSRIESVRKSRKDFCVIPVDGQERIVQGLMTGQSHVDIYIPEYALLLRCEIKQTDAPVRYYLHLPQFVAQVDRRKSLRLVLEEPAEIKMNFSKTVSNPRPMTQHFLKSCYDISTGGFSFYVSKMESKFFSEGDVISNLEIKTGDMQSKVEANIVAIKEIEPDEFNKLNYKVWKICCKFSKIDQISKKYIDKFILERIKEELHAIN